MRISELRSKLTRSDGVAHPISASLVAFEEISMREKLAEQMYTLARDAVERARQAAEKQWVYVAVFAPPGLPEYSLYPRRWAFTALAFVGLTVFWCIGAVTWASIQDHRL
jgi:capsular polysaccharide transport system permease protein